MLIDNSFRIDVPVHEAWRVLLDLDLIAPCLPGVTVAPVEGDEHHGVVTVEVGPIAAQYQGTAKLERADDVTHTAVFVANGRETGGHGDVSATIQLQLSADGDSTRVDVDIDLSITGKVAQFGRDVMAEASTHLLAEFVENLERDVLNREVDLTEPEREPGAARAGQPDPLEDDASDELVADAVAAAAEPAAAPSGNGAAVRKPDPSDIEPLEPVELGGSPALRRVAPLAGFVVVALVLRWLVRRRRH